MEALPDSSTRPSMNLIMVGPAYHHDDYDNNDNCGDNKVWWSIAWTMINLGEHNYDDYYCDDYYHDQANQKFLWIHDDFNI